MANVANNGVENGKKNTALDEALDAILGDMSNEVKVTRSGNGGNGVPFKEIVSIINTVFDKTGIKVIPVSVMKAKVAAIYKVKHEGDEAAMAKLTVTSKGNNLYRAVYMIASGEGYKQFERVYNENDVVCIQRK